MSDRHWAKMFDRCPFCGNAYFLAGPRGGMSQNFKCSDCGATFNHVGPFGVDLIISPYILIKLVENEKGTP